MVSIRAPLVRMGLRLRRHWWTSVIAVLAAVSLAMWGLTSGWIASAGAVVCMLCMIPLWLVATISRDPIMDAVEEVQGMAQHSHDSPGCHDEGGWHDSGASSESDGGHDG